MTNHVHLLVTPETVDGVSRMMQRLGRHYVRYFNHTCKRTGTLWERRFKSCVVDAENYILICLRRAAHYDLDSIIVGIKFTVPLNVIFTQNGGNYFTVISTSIIYIITMDQGTRYKV